MKGAKRRSYGTKSWGKAKVFRTDAYMCLQGYAILCCHACHDGKSSLGATQLRV
jgi:hypothetical protein